MGVPAQMETVAGLQEHTVPVEEPMSAGEAFIAALRALTPEERAGLRGPRVRRDCPWPRRCCACARSFLYRHRHKRYCSGRCRVRACRARQRVRLQFTTKIVSPSHRVTEGPI